MITVSKDNTGDYTSIQEAVDAISSSTVSETIFIKNVVPSGLILSLYTPITSTPIILPS